jgi:hypothetical protein
MLDASLSRVLVRQNVFRKVCPRSTVLIGSHIRFPVFVLDLEVGWLRCGAQAEVIIVKTVVLRWIYTLVDAIVINIIRFFCCLLLFFYKQLFDHLHSERQIHYVVLVYLRQDYTYVFYLTKSAKKRHQVEKFSIVWMVIPGGDW